MVRGGRVADLHHWDPAASWFGPRPGDGGDRSAANAANDRQADSAPTGGEPGNRDGRIEAGSIEAGSIEAGSIEAGSIQADSGQAGSSEPGSQAGFGEPGSLEADFIGAGSIGAGRIEGTPVRPGGSMSVERVAGSIGGGT